jgi:hypothetical protein
MSTTATTTIRIPRYLHQVLAEQAQRRGTTMVSVIEESLRRLVEDEFWRQTDQSMSQPETAAQIQSDLAEWDATLSDGLVEEDWSWLT